MPKFERNAMNHQNPAAGHAAALLRVTLGITLVAHGLMKVFIFTLPGTAAFFASQGFPGWSAYPVVAVEILGGAALVVGWQARLAALTALPVLLGALSVHAGNGWVFNSPKGGWEYPAFLVVSAIAVMLQGAGAFALERARPQSVATRARA
jgi:putative oxidoreductase